MHSSDDLGRSTVLWPSMLWSVLILVEQVFLPASVLYLRQSTYTARLCCSIDCTYEPRVFTSKIFKNSKVTLRLKHPHINYMLYFQYSVALACSSDADAAVQYTAITGVRLTSRPVRICVLQKALSLCTEFVHTYKLNWTKAELASIVLLFYCSKTHNYL